MSTETVSVDVLAAQVRADLEWFRGDHLPHGSHEDMFRRADRSLMWLDALVARVTEAEANAEERHETGGSPQLAAADDPRGRRRVTGLLVRNAFDLRYHVPRSQVWEGSRGGQTGKVHLYVKAGEAFQAGRIRRVERETLCGRVAWSSRPAEDGETLCPRCIEIGTRANGRLFGLVAARLDGSSE